MATDPRFNQLAEPLFHQIGKSVALEMLLRGLYSKWALDNKDGDDPEDFVFKTIEGLIGSFGRIPLNETKGEAATLEKMIREIAEEEIRIFGGQVIERLRSLRPAGAAPPA
ncbi:MAG TPA: hypothetical protein VHY35_01670 [Stellaceae bacterium]|jgi:hypothetical protein|nr:hypothetical protein [Stellaceae bacterium]